MPRVHGLDIKRKGTASRRGYVNYSAPDSTWTFTDSSSTTTTKKDDGSTKKHDETPIANDRNGSPRLESRVGNIETPRKIVDKGKKKQVSFQSTFRSRKRGSSHRKKADFSPQRDEPTRLDVPDREPVQSEEKEGKVPEEATGSASEAAHRTEQPPQKEDCLQGAQETDSDIHHHGDDDSDNSSVTKTSRKKPRLESCHPETEFDDSLRQGAAGASIKVGATNTLSPDASAASSQLLHDLEIQRLKDEFAGEVAKIKEEFRQKQQRLHDNVLQTPEYRALEMELVSTRHQLLLQSEIRERQDKEIELLRKKERFHRHCLRLWELRDREMWNRELTLEQMSQQLSRTHRLLLANPSLR